MIEILSKRNWRNNLLFEFLFQQRIKGFSDTFLINIKLDIVDFSKDFQIQLDLFKAII